MNWFYPRIAAAACSIIFLPAIANAQLVPTRNTVVELTATTQASAPHITLAWDAEPTATSLSVWRRPPGTATWTLLANLPVTDTTFADSSALPGVMYEYRVKRHVPQPPPVRADADQFGIIAAAHDLPLTENRGRVVVVVDNTMTSPLAAELAQLRTNLAGDGWTVRYHTSARQSVGFDDETSGAARLAELTALKSLIASEYTAAPSSTRAVFLLGRLPVPFSGVIVPDGHDETAIVIDNHKGAWPADGYYADIDGVWTDTTKNYTQTPAVPRRHNVPGDGKFDQNVYPSALELELGRVDLADMTTVPSGVNEATLLQRYLQRDHLFRHNAGRFQDVPRRALIEDQFGVYQDFDQTLQVHTYEPFAASGWRNGIAWFGSANTNLLRWEDEIYENKYLFAYGCGGGSYDGASGVAYNSTLANNDSYAVFTMLLGSYFGEWSYPNCFLRAPLAGKAGSMGLTCEWAGRPHYYHMHMALGETIGHGTRISQNNSSGNFDPVGHNREVHMALMGDPTLRLHGVSPVSAVVANYSSAQNQVALSWAASSDAAVLGYHVFRSLNPDGPFTRITGVPATSAIPHGSPISGTNFTDASPISGHANHYFVRAVKREVSASGSYFNMSTGIPANASVPNYAFTNWQTSHGLSGTVLPSDDSDADGLSLLLEYALGGNPINSSGATLPAATITSGSLAIGFSRKITNSDLTLTVQAADSPSGPWTDLARSVNGETMTPIAPAAVVNETGAGPTRSVVVQDIFPLNDPAHPRRFMRLHVAQP
jgi:hypothetical protein